jgi:tetratricopeptide (TPR) repeat protein
MKFYNLYIKYRFYLGLVCLAGAVFIHIQSSSFWSAFLLYLIGVISIFSHFFFGPLRLIQQSLEGGDISAAEKVLDSVWFPNLLFKPIRSVFYTLKGNLAMYKQDFEGAEKHLNKGQSLMSGNSSMGIPMKEASGANHLQLGMLSLQKNDLKKAESHIRQALRDGLPDKENRAVAYLQMSSIMMNRREFRSAKDFFKKAKLEKPQTKEITDQIKQMEKYISRIPG